MKGDKSVPGCDLLVLATISPVLRSPNDGKRAADLADLGGIVFFELGEVGNVALGTMHRHPDRARSLPFGGSRATDPCECQTYLCVDEER